MKPVIRKTLMIAVSIGVLGYGALRVYLNQMDTLPFRQAIVKGLDESTGIHFKIDALSLEPTVFHGLMVHLRGITLTDMKGHPLGRVATADVQIRYWPLLADLLPQISRIELRHIYVPIGPYNLFHSLHLRNVKPEQTGLLKPAELHNATVEALDYQVIDQQPSPGSSRVFHGIRQFQLLGKRFSIQHLMANKPITFSGGGRFQLMTQKNVQTSELTQVLGDYSIGVTLPQDVVKGGAFQLDDLHRLDVSIQNKTANAAPLNFDFRYQVNGRGKREGQFQTNQLDLQKLQAFGFQWANTLGVPIPAPYNHLWLRGKLKANTRFEVGFKNHQPYLIQANGLAQLHQVGLEPSLSAQSEPTINGLNGEVQLLGQSLKTHALNVLVNGTPVHIKGQYNWKQEWLNGRLYTRGLSLPDLQQKAVAYGVPAPALKGRTLGGLMDINVHSWGPIKQLNYQGLVSLKHGNVADAGIGFRAQRVSGQVRFKGKGVDHPTVAYSGHLQAEDGQLALPRQGLNVRHFTGNVAFQGQVRPQDFNRGHQPDIPQLAGTVQITDTDYKDPKTGILVSGIQGLFALAQNQIELKQGQGTLAGSLFQATGRLATDLKHYDFRVVSQNINVSRFKQTVLAKIDAAQPYLAMVQPYQGQANLDMRVSTGLNLAGNLSVNDLALRTSESAHPIQIPRMRLSLQGQKIQLATTNILYDTLSVRVGGQADLKGHYAFRIDSDEIPMTFIRENEALLAGLSGASLPEIWNAEGGVALHGNLSNQSKQVGLDFNQVGLSWEGGDFPIYGLNGQLQMRQQGNQDPSWQSQGLAFHYGNSPVLVNLQEEQHLDASLQGVLSPLLVNHYLVSSQSNATPYRDVPFQFQVAGKVAGMPGDPQSKHNSLVANAYFDLKNNFEQNSYSPSETVDNNAPSAETDEDGEELTDAQAQNAAPAPDILGLDQKRGQPLQNINAINAANTTIELFRQTVGVGLGGLKKPVGFLESTVLKPVKAVTQFTTRQANEALAPSPSPAQPTTNTSPVSQAINSGLPMQDAYLALQASILGDNLSLNHSQLHIFNGGDILVDGHIHHLDKLSQPEQLTYQMHVMTSPQLDLAAIDRGSGGNEFFQGADGSLVANLTFSRLSPDLSPVGMGWLEVNQLKIPYLTLQDLSGRLDLQGETGTALLESFKIPGVNAKGSARTENIFEVPVTLEDVDIQGNFVSIASLGDFNQKILKPIIVDQIMHNFMRPWQQGDPTSPVQFRNARLRVAELIYQNIILGNVQSAFSLYPNSFFELTNTTLEAAGGKVNGYLSLSPNENSFTTLELNANGVKANALTKALLNVTNQIFGDLNGTVRFTTFGQNDVDMQRNANGTVSMKITNGRLPAIAKVETLLAAANVFRGGLLGLNLNNLFRSLTFYDTNYFAELSGDMLINNQVLYTQNLVSDGKDLDLLIQGSLRMDNGNANMLVNGRMSQNVSGKLGALGNLSLNRIIHYIPALGNLGANQPGLLGYIPGVGYVPGFGGPAGRYNRFQVRLVGQPDDPKAIQDFHWVKPQNL